MQNDKRFACVNEQKLVFSNKKSIFQLHSMNSVFARKKFIQMQWKMLQLFFLFNKLKHAAFVWEGEKLYSKVTKARQGKNSPAIINFLSHCRSKRLVPDQITISNLSYSMNIFSDYFRRSHVFRVNCRECENVPENSANLSDIIEETFDKKWTSLQMKLIKEYHLAVSHMF